jgi:Uma2 family endonuclease
MTPINHIPKGEKDMAVAVETKVKPGKEIVLDPEREYEIVKGQPIEKKPGGALHGGVCARFAVTLGNYVEAHSLGEVYGPNTTFTFGQNQRIPDISFVSAKRFPPTGEPEGVWEIAPDLTVEIVAPHDTFNEIEGRVWEYFAGGVWQVWIVSPALKTVMIYDSPVRMRVLVEGDELSSEELLPGFRCRLSEIFRSLAHSQA